MKYLGLGSSVYGYGYVRDFFLQKWLFLGVLISELNGICSEENSFLKSCLSEPQVHPRLCLHI